MGRRPIPFPAGVRSTARQPTPDYWLEPHREAPERWPLLIHEVAGWLTYKAAGYL